jgi:hypothetical protein
VENFELFFFISFLKIGKKLLQLRNKGAILLNVAATSEQPTKKKIKNFLTLGLQPDNIIKSP